MKKIIVGFLACCSFSHSQAQQNIVACQYWFDRDYGNAVTDTMGTNEFLANIPATSLLPGEHQIHFRTKQSDGKWTTVISQEFIRPVDLVKYEYWLDKDFANRVSVNLSNAASLDMNSLVDANSLSSGRHAFSFRCLNSKHQWSSAITQHFIVGSQIDQCEFWFDKDYANRSQISLTPAKYFPLDSLISASNLAGSHVLNYRTHQTNGIWSSVLSQNFVKQNKLIAFEYWYNDAYANRMLQTIPGTGDVELNQTIDVSASPIGSNMLFMRFKDETGKWSQVITNGFCHNDGDSAITIKVYLEGYYQGSGLMTSVMQNQGVGNNALVCDSIDVELRQSSSPYNLVETKRAELKTDGIAKCYFSPSLNGSFFLAVHHRNGIATWSAVPVFKGICPTYYDFTTAASKAYGNNVTEVEPGIWAFYSGDINQDENIDLLDLAIQEADISDFQFGYLPTDLNGDGNIDLLDSPMLEANINQFVFAIHP